MRQQYIIEFKTIIKLASPLMLAQLAQTAMGFTDTIMAGHYSVTDLAAVSIGAGVWIPVMLFLHGTLMALTPLIAHAHGEKDNKEIATCFKHGLILALILGILFGLITSQLHHILPLLGANASLTEISKLYLYAIAATMPGFALFQVLRSYVEGMTHTRIVMLFSLIALLINIPTNYIFIYGKWGAPELGGFGCGIATAMAQYFTIACFIIFLKVKGWLSHLELNSVQIAFKHFSAILKLGLPIGAAIFVEASVFSIIAVALVTLGETVVSGHQIALNFSSLVFMIPLSLSNALTIRIGNLIGQNQIAHTPISIHIALGSAIAIAAINATFIYFFREQISQAYTDSSEVIQVATTLLVFSAIFQFSDAIQIVCSGGLRGFKRTTTAFWITLTAFWVCAFPLGYILTFTDFLTEAAMGAKGFWIGLTIGLSAAATALSGYLIYVTRNEITRRQMASA